MTDIATIIPTGNTVGEIGAALTRLAEARATAERRLVVLKEERAGALLDLNANLFEHERAFAETNIYIERLDALQPMLEGRLEEAQRAAEQHELNQVCDQASVAIQKFRVALRDYSALSDKMIQILRLGEAAHAAVRYAASRGLTGFDLPGLNVDLAAVPDLSGGLLFGHVTAPPGNYTVAPHGPYGD